MSTVYSGSESVKKAVRWISDRLKEDAGTKRKKLINEAISRFDLSPKESQQLWQWYLSGDDPSHQ